MALFKNDQFVSDPWRTLAEGEGISAAGHVILPLNWWLQEREAFAGSHAKLGVLMEPDDDLAALQADLPQLSLIALDFPKFGDGRAFSMAALLRTRHGFKGELRAVGEVLFDQLQHMQRCGFDAFDIKDEATLRALQAGKRPGVGHFYQPARDSSSIDQALREVPAGTRPWLRQPAG